MTSNRKRTTPDGAVSHNITLSAEDWRVIEDLGRFVTNDGTPKVNRSAGVRALLRPAPGATPTIEPLREAVLRFWAALDRLNTVGDDAAHNEYHAARTAVFWIATETFKPVTKPSQEAQS